MSEGHQPQRPVHKTSQKKWPGLLTEGLATGRMWVSGPHCLQAAPSARLLGKGEPVSRVRKLRQTQAGLSLPLSLSHTHTHWESHSRWLWGLPPIWMSTLCVLGPISDTGSCTWHPGRFPSPACCATEQPRAVFLVSSYPAN